MGLQFKIIYFGLNIVILLTYFNGPKTKHTDLTNNFIWYVLDRGYQRLCSLTLKCLTHGSSLHFSLVSLNLFISK